MRMENTTSHLLNFQVKFSLIHNGVVDLLSIAKQCGIQKRIKGCVHLCRSHHFMDGSNRLIVKH